MSFGIYSIADEMKDNELGAGREDWIDEGMPVVIDPKIINPSDFIHEVVEKRLPNPFVPILRSVSQRIPVRKCLSDSAKLSKHMFSAMTWM